MIIVLTPESPIIKSVFARCLLDEGHFMWTGGTSKGGGKAGQPGPGYPSVWVPEMKTTVRGHRLIFAAFFGTWNVPLGYHREHVCNRSLCLNPACMELVTSEENQRRKIWRDESIKNGAELICPPCKEAGDILSTRKDLPEFLKVETTLMITERHDSCRGGTWCNCQHVVPALSA